MEFNIINKSEVPKTLYHLVPNIYFSDFIKSDGSYDCRRDERWGRGEDFIHTSSSVQILRDRVVGNRWTEFKKFYLLTINTV